ncbi:disease resistance protein RPV1-like [Populus nigra]|uniref:disease resistance protein RPV1-like n=1 Tax=Populus nigra TaxID=3691 RepID=UPI002B26FB48|nr:disease resistance protein RPV1-like [Populus nigra]XP_061987785.1 disease resistance protein RPV1-like [Populus nigra]
MASSSAVAHKRKYDVFLSFRGKDTRNNFTSHLYDDLCRKKIKTFIDDGLERGEEITGALLRTIEESRISVIIFSRNYASSPWCVDELVKILECKKAYGQIVLPVFYHVDPSDVDEQTGSFGNAFAELERNFKQKMDKVPRWRSDLTSAANISGWDSQVIRPDSRLVDQIVHHILKKLNYASSSDLKGLVGMDSRMKQIEALLCTQLPEVCVVGIWGMGGIGKTTIAGEIFNKIAREYEGHYFLANVREELEKNGGLFRMRDDLFSKITEEENLHIRTPRIGHPFIKDRICRKKVLIVFDDVNNVDQIEMLLGGCDFFGPGSRIILTSRDKQVLKKYSDKIFEVGGLNYQEALHLFSLHAFKDNQPPYNYMELSVRAINYAKGNPLALKVLGSFLFGRTRKEWGSALNKVEKLPQKEVHGVLRISFDALDREEKSIFLDIACFFKGQNIDFIKRILDGCGFSADIGISVLVDKCLVTISGNKIGMHDLLQHMAHEIVSMESVKDPGKRSRLWHFDDVYEVLTRNLGTKNVEGIFVDLDSSEKVMKVSSRAFARMYNLKLLKVYNSGFGNNSKVLLPHGLDSISNELRYLHWDGYPLRSLPFNFIPQNLVEINISSSKVEQLWQGNQNLVNLKEVNLSNCKHLTEIPDLSQAANLESLNLQSCTSLTEVPQSIRYLDKLSDFNLRSCTSLISLPSSINLKSLKTLNLSGCLNLKNYPEIAENVQYLNLNETSVPELPRSIEHLGRLVALNLRDCKQLGNLPDDVCSLKSLEIADLSGCSNITMFPAFPEKVRYIYLSGTAIEEVPSSIDRLSRLFSLDLMGCKRLKNLPCTFSRLASLEKLSLSGCSIITEFPELPVSIKELNLDGTAIREIPSSVEHLSNLVELSLQNCTRFEILPGSIFNLESLKKLNLFGCSQFQTFPSVNKFGRLTYLCLDGTAIRALPWTIEGLASVSRLEMKNCRNLECNLLPEVQSLLNFNVREVKLYRLRQLHLNDCNLLCLPGSLSCLSSLEVLDLSGNSFITLPILSKLLKLESLILRNCFRLVHIPTLPPRLMILDAHNCSSVSGVQGSRYSTEVEGNIFDFLFTNCFGFHDKTVCQCNEIIEYSLTKIKVYAKRLYAQMPFVLPGTSSACFPGRNVPDWFVNQTQGFSLTIKLPSQCASNQFLGFVLCAVVDFGCLFKSSDGFKVNCIYHIKNEYGDSHHLQSYFGGWFDGEHVREVSNDMLFLGYDPCLEFTECYLFGKCSEVVIEFYSEDRNNNPLKSCNVIKCGVCLLSAEDDNS